MTSEQWKALAPVNRAGYLIEAGAALCASAIVSEYRHPFVEFEHVWHLPIPELKIDPNIRDFGVGLNSLFPITTAVTRYLVLPTKASPWCAVFFNSAADQKPKFIAGLNRAVKGRVIYYFSSEHTLKKTSGNRYIGHYGGCGLWLFESGKPFQPDRAISCVRETSGWKFDQVGDPLPFEDIDQYKQRSKRDRFNESLLRTYLSALAIDPFESSSFSVSSTNPGSLIALQDLPDDISTVDEKDLEQQWYKEMGKDERNWRH